MQRVLQALRVRRVGQALQVKRALQVRVARREIQVRLEKWALREIMVLQVLRVRGEGLVL